ncbi:adenylosuccinate lyase [bacterium]|nr:adenylosuccinate lyase [bacterium]
MSLTAISPIDGRYAAKVKELKNYFSEYALIKYRLTVEIEYFIALCEMPLPQLIKFPAKDVKLLKELIKDFDEAEAEKVKEIEKVTNHDVKAVEYYLKQKFEEMGFGNFTGFIHFGLTSQDINNTAIPLALRNYLEKVYIPFIEEEILNELSTIASEWKNVPMLARTHGQPATPTTIGRELLVFAERIIQQLRTLKNVPHTCKFGGATGGLNAHYATYAAINWNNFANEFCLKKLGLERQKFTTQIENYDFMASIFDNLRRINNILVDLSRDVWTYVSMDYFGQRSKKNEVGSSTMPHKVNPIDFENAEGNLLMANAIFDFLANKLPVSRLQRDLTDSTVTRNIGVPMAHTTIALKSLKTGLGKLTLNNEVIATDLANNFVVVAEAIQTILRREGFPEPYEALKEFTRGKKRISKADIHSFIDSLDVKDMIKEELKELSPETYIGVSNSLTALK